MATIPIEIFKNALLEKKTAREKKMYSIFALS